MAGRERRSDAVANRDRIVEVARAELSESNGATDGLKLHRVAKAAGVGQGTLYRHFPTREHLLAEVYRAELTQLVDTVAPLLAEHSPLDALTRWLDRLVEYARVKRGVMAAIEVPVWQDLYSGQHHRLDEALETLLDQGKAAGEIRGGVDAADVILLLGALSRIPEAEWDERAPRIVAVIVDGLRA
ncbi:TetR family transcriptional regulator [Amycolatopsis mediterranei S699]|uniref:TetR family transcriptional regulator n=2 Tax=Amycolatopsis mediterranei TaxID=33910 RepID=A0A0H3D556_AMYMU|nr:TetR/AcrR family transcriptional regulator [Amycolatopsis mediterranei]ADJ45392.1 TetR family transcriptional regulator [Amycolatopsis mediterranei U32]AEK42155.1 TetR family transcriptional regulator [Amycolatopsis mediterranei S699]AFO77103.1 TetR family transcriptional regulator [Amycolatopsis mediterranei S699]AGT84231.1 TetR family transcriptional regulator [Amycolatopsis mediterranei RB]KDO05969.1 TetR family transcriptional regulator [Amycolatopsis mediterranei]